MIDFHCHLDLYPDPLSVVNECQLRSVHVLSVTTTPSAWKGTSALAVNSPQVRTALGLHPQLAHERKGELDIFEQLLPDVQFVGEVGLDGTPEFKRHWNDQLMVFSRILDVCETAGGRVMSIHSRRAASAVLDLLEEKAGAGTPVLHWFSGSLRELTRAVELGCWFSVGPAMLGSEKGRMLASHMPRDRMLTESDGPFVQVNGRAALPWNVRLATEKLAEIWKEPESSIELLLTDNLIHLLNKSAIRS